MDPKNTNTNTSKERDAAQRKPEPISSRDLPEQPRGPDEERGRQNAIIKDKHAANGGDTDAIHGDGSDIGLDNNKP